MPTCLLPFWLILIWKPGLMSQVLRCDCVLGSKAQSPEPSLAGLGGGSRSPSTARAAPPTGGASLAVAAAGTGPLGMGGWYGGCQGQGGGCRWRSPALSPVPEPGPVAAGGGRCGGCGGCGLGAATGGSDSAEEHCPAAGSPLVCMGTCTDGDSAVSCCPRRSD